MDKSSTTEMSEDSLPLKSNSMTEYEASVIEMSIDCWRLQKLFLKMARQLDAGAQGRYESQLRYFRKNSQDILDRFGLKLINLLILTILIKFYRINNTLPLRLLTIL